MTIRQHHRSRPTLAASVWFCRAAIVVSFASVAAHSQQSGTALSDTVTFSGTGTATMEIAVSGPRDPNTATILSLDFGQDGTGVPAASVMIPDTVSFTVSNAGNSKTFSPAGSDTSQPFPNKQVNFSRPDMTSRPNLFALSVIHLAEIPAGTAETWRVTVAGLPLTNWRAIGTVQQGNFTSLTPSGFSYGINPIDIAPVPVMTGGTATLTVTSRTGFDLSHVGPAQVSISPDDDIGPITVTQASAQSLTLSFEVLNSADPGNWTLNIRANDTTVHGTFAVAQGPAIRISPPIKNPNSPSASAWVITSPGDLLDFSTVTAADVSLTGRLGAFPTFTGHPTISDQTNRSMKISIGSFGDKRPTLSLKVNNRTFRVSIATEASDPFRTCLTGDRCCDVPRPIRFPRLFNRACIVCLPRDQLCR